MSWFQNAGMAAAANTRCILQLREGRLRAPISLEWDQQRERVNAQGFCYAIHIVDRNIPGLAFYMGDKGPMEPTFVGKHFLRPPFSLTQPHYVEG
jgi:hypothetical protein